jgi:hypothetical protein
MANLPKKEGNRGSEGDTAGKEETEMEGEARKEEE